jgi:hypothetical protein
MSQNAIHPCVLCSADVTKQILLSLYSSSQAVLKILLLLPELILQTFFLTVLFITVAFPGVQDKFCLKST